jgi:pimeloyl-ACP methyl ester carboxylesterase
MKTASSVLPFYFGSGEKQLYGCYHAPRTEQSRNCGVVICQPMGHEYIYCHRALRQLATRLADVGFPVLRFDFYGCGDSSGDLDDAGISQWLQDISTSITELRSRTGIRQICLIGVRLGAALSFITAAEEDGITAVVLWDPVVSGNAYIEEIRLLQREALRSRLKSLWRKESSEEEVIGFPLSVGVRTAIGELNLLTIAPKTSMRMLTVQSEEAANYDSLNHHLRRRGVQFDHQQLQAPKIWLPTIDGSLLVPTQILRSVVSWTCAQS